MSASIINTNNNTKIFSTNNINKIEVSNENIIQSDSESREVIKKGYLLSQINLTSIPDIIQEAINSAMLTTKEQTLADALIETLRLSISNLDDGVYKKTYIDNTISYLENLLVSKASPEVVASIADSKLAIALQDFASASSVSALNSRVGNSETSIQNVIQTINTKDTARALEMVQMEARINDAFAGYSEAIDLYVDAQGNVKSEKIETLTTNIGLQLQEINELIVDRDNEWNAKSVKLITSPSGAITGYSFQDGSGLKSNFDINADNFKISNSYNTYTPFSISGTSLYFNGKVTFSNVTGTDNLALKDMSNVTTIDGGKITTNQAFVDKLNATGGVIADTVTANEFIGKTFTGSVINGAVINGAVVKASYLDLDGELEVLTNYHITPAMHNANPSLYTDAVYLSGTNEYRIPSISTVREAAKTKTFTAPGSENGILYSYNTANVGTNNKAVRVRPYFTNTSPFTIISSHSTRSHSGLTNYLLSNHFKLSLGSIVLFECKVEYSSAAGLADGNLFYCTTTYSGAYFTTATDFTNRYYSNNPDVNTNHFFNIGIGTLKVAFSSAYDYGDVNITCTLEVGTMELLSNWDNGSLKFEQIITPINGSSTFSLNNGLYINNMI